MGMQRKCPQEGCGEPCVAHCTPRNVCNWWVCNSRHPHTTWFDAKTGRPREVRKYKRPDVA